MQYFRLTRQFGTGSGMKAGQFVMMNPLIQDQGLLWLGVQYDVVKLKGWGG